MSKQVLKVANKKISIQEVGDIIHVGNMLEFIKDNELNNDEINMLENLVNGQQCLISSGQGFATITRLK